jgi:hypothetical protein
LHSSPRPSAARRKPGDHILLAPHFTVEEVPLDPIVDRLHATLDAAFATV